MEKIIKEGKVLEDILNDFYEESGLTENDIIYAKETKKGGLFKGDTVVVTITKKDDVYEMIKDYLKELVTNLGLEVNFEMKTKDDRKTIKMYSNNNQILIGRNGQTLKALETLVRQKIILETGESLKISLDVENYKDIRDKKIIRLARQTAKDVAKTKTKAILEDMSSYDRRLIHNALTDFKGVTTHSEGEEPHRHIVIEPED
jgi:spoIIIJ-associated protein